MKNISIANKPLLGKKVLITRAKNQALPLSKKLKNLGAIPLKLPTIKIIPKNSAELDGTIGNLNKYDWIIFTSVNGVKFFWQRAKKIGFTAKEISQIKIAAVGPATAYALKKRKLKVNFFPKNFLTREIVTGLGKLSGKRVLLPRADIAKSELKEILSQKGAIVNQVSAYSTILAKSSSKLKTILKEEEIDWITFTSSSTVKNFTQLLNGINKKILAKTKIACIGPVTAKTAAKAGFTVDIVAKIHTIDGLVDAIVKKATKN